MKVIEEMMSSAIRIRVASEIFKPKLDSAIQIGMQILLSMKHFHAINGNRARDSFTVQEF